MTSITTHALPFVYSGAMRGLLVAAIVLATIDVAHAQAPGETLTSKEVTVRRRDPNKATLLTGLGIAAPAAMVTLGLTTDIDEGGFAAMGFTLGWITPAAGHWYAGRVGTYGMLGRMGGVVFFMTGVEEISDAKKCARGIEVTDGCDGVSRGAGRAFIGLGLSLYAGSLIYDFVTSRREVHQYNRRHTLLQVAPIVTHGSTGFAVGGAF